MANCLRQLCCNPVAEFVALRFGSLRLTNNPDRKYYCDSAQKLWRKGEESGHVQSLKEIRLDCDNDVILMQVEQIGGIACHTGREHCFYKRLLDGKWVAVDPVIKDPKEIYK